MVAGVAGGLAAFLNIDPSLVRILWVVLIPLTGGLILLLYLAMALIVPQQRFDDDRWRAWEAQSGASWAPQAPRPPPESNDPVAGRAAFAADPPPSEPGASPASDSPLDAMQRRPPARTTRDARVRARDPSRRRARTLTAAARSGPAHRGPRTRPGPLPRPTAAHMWRRHRAPPRPDGTARASG